MAIEIVSPSFHEEAKAAPIASPSTQLWRASPAMIMYAIVGNLYQGALSLNDISLNPDIDMFYNYESTCINLCHLWSKKK